MTSDNTAPLAPSAPDLLASSDTGSFNNDDVTMETMPAFQGVAETNTRIRILANGLVVGEATVGTDATDGVLGNGLGVWEVTVEPLADGNYAITAQSEDLAGNIGPQSPALAVTIDTQAPDTPYLDLDDASDSGRSNRDNITNDNTPTVTTTADDVQAAGVNAASHEIRYRIFDRMGTGPDVLLVNSFATIPGLSTSDFFTDTLPTLADGVHNFKAEVEDRAGNVSHTFLLQVTIDTVAPASPTLLIDPSEH